jgi:hypothetical protein
VNVNFEKSATNPKVHLTEILEQIKLKGGLDYLPRERTSSGRLFEHASECKVLLKHLRTLK